MRALLLVLLLSSTAWANAPAPWAVCAGKKAGDKCGSFLYYRGGRCVVREPGQCGGQTGGTCLMCESSCAIAPGSSTGIGALALLAPSLLLLLLRRGRRARDGR